MELLDLVDGPMGLMKFETRHPPQPPSSSLPEIAAPLLGVISRPWVKSGGLRGIAPRGLHRPTEALTAPLGGVPSRAAGPAEERIDSRYHGLRMR